jgi:hypothetical protein
MVSFKHQTKPPEKKDGNSLQSEQESMTEKETKGGWSHA